MKSHQVHSIAISFVCIFICLVCFPSVKAALSTDTLSFNLSDSRLTGQMIEIPVYLSSETEVTSFDFQLKFNTDKVSFHNIVVHSDYLNHSFYFNPIDSFLRFSSISLQPIEKHVPLLTIQLKRKSGVINVSDLKTLIGWINGNQGVTQSIGNICQGDSLLLDAEGTPGSTYLWSNTITGRFSTAFTAGSYYAIITDPTGDVSSSTVYTLKDKSLPVSENPVPSAESFCPGDSVQITLNTELTNLIEWSSGETGISIFTSEAGIYHAKVYNESGCFILTDSIEILSLPLPNTDIQSSDALEFCEGDSVILFANFVSGQFYQWSNGSVSYHTIVRESGKYSVRVTGVNGCSASSDSIIVTVFPLPIAQISIIGAQKACFGDSLILEAYALPGYQFSWSTNETERSIIIRNSGDYFVTITDSNECQSQSEYLNINFQILEGDLNDDGYVNGVDYLLLISFFGYPCDSCSEDFNHDGVVDGMDYLLFIANFGMTCYLN